MTPPTKKPPTVASSDRCVVAFDLDNTLLDADMRGYNAAVRGLLDTCPLGLSTADAYEAFEAIRRVGGVLERIGLRSPVHDRANPDALTVMILTRCTNDALLRELATSADAITNWRTLVDELADVHRAATRGYWTERLEDESKFRRFLSDDPRVRPFRDEVARVAALPQVKAWSARYRELELGAPVQDHRPMLAALTARGFRPVVITQGRSAIQLDKLRRLGLGDVLSERVLITEAAGTIAGLSELDAAIDRLFAVTMQDATRDANHDELRFLWRFRCVLDAWSLKSPAFYGRCLHAIHANPERPAVALSDRAVVPTGRWRERPLRFVMIGDRHRKDIAPVQTLLGRGVGMTIRLRMGKYSGADSVDDSSRAEAASRTFSDWESLRRFLLEDFDPADIVAIDKPPTLIPTSTLDAEAIERAHDSPLEAVREIAALVGRTMSESRQLR